MKLQFFADPPAGSDNPPAGGNQPGAGGQQPRTFTEEELHKAADAAAAKARKEAEGKLKPQLEQAQQALEAAKPFLEDQPGYIARYLAANPALIQPIADAAGRIMQGQAPTMAQIGAVHQAAQGAEDPKVAKRLEAMETELKAQREVVQEQQALQGELKTFAKEAKAEGLSWDQDAFLEFANKYAEENEIDDEDPIDTRLLFRLWRAEQKLAAGPGRKPPKLPGGSPPPSAPKPQAKTWADAEAAMEAALRASRE